MPKSEWIFRSTPFPNVLLDELMPKLRDSEWRLVCIVVRQTLGWVDPLTGRRKRSDWLSHRQLIIRSGRQSAALSRALDVLSRSEVIDITDDFGRRLETAAKRRRHRGKMRIGLNRRWIPSYQ